MRSNLQSPDFDAEFQQMEREIRTFYRQQRLEDAAWWLAIAVSLCGVVGVLAWVKP